MKALKNLLILSGILISIYLLTTSCEEMFGDYLDKPPGVDVTEDTIFSTQENANKLLTAIYSQGVSSGLGVWNDWNGRRAETYSCWTDEGEQVAGWYTSNRVNAGRLNPTYIGGESGGPAGGRWATRFTALRSISIFLDRVDDLPDAESGWINEAKGQVMFIRALCYFDMFKRYGGVPIIDQRLEADVNDPQGLKIPRSSVKETVDFIVDQCDAAAALLPDTWPEEDIGRASKGAALMLKARTLLYAASPLSNTGDPVVPLPGHDELVCYGNYDVNRWQLAADAAQAVLDWAPAGGKKLVENRGVDPNWGVDISYFETWHEADNEESIFAAKNLGEKGAGATPWKSLNNFYWSQGGSMVNQNFVEKYEKRDGTPQTWNPAGGDNLNDLYAELDPRFIQSVGYAGSYWNVDFPVLKTWVGGAPSSKPPLLGLKTGAWQRKHVPPEMTNSNKNGWLLWNMFRLGEAYLIKAEALNEAQGPVPAAYAAVNIIRARAGMPDFPPGLSQDEFRTKIQNERSIEMYAENVRFWDVMRWLIADKTDPVTGKAILNGPMWGLKITKEPDPSMKLSYEPYVYEDRTWIPAQYHWPFHQNEVNKGYLIQTGLLIIISM